MGISVNSRKTGNLATKAKNSISLLTKDYTWIRNESMDLPKTFYPRSSTFYLDEKMDLNKFSSSKYVANYKNWGVNLLQRWQMPHLPRYLHSLLFGMQMWHLPSLPHIYSSVLHFCNIFARCNLCNFIFHAVSTLHRRYKPTLLLVIDHVLTVDIIGLVEKMVGGIQKHQLLWQTLPSLFPSFTLSPLPPPFLHLPRRLLALW